MRAQVAGAGMAGDWLVDGCRHATPRLLDFRHMWISRSLDGEGEQRNGARDSWEGRQGGSGVGWHGPVITGTWGRNGRTDAYTVVTEAWGLKPGATDVIREPLAYYR